MKFWNNRIVYEIGDRITPTEDLHMLSSGDLAFKRGKSYVVTDVTPHDIGVADESDNRTHWIGIPEKHATWIQFFNPSTQAEIDEALKPKFKIGDWVTVLNNSPHYHYCGETGKVIAPSSDTPTDRCINVGFGHNSDGGYDIEPAHLRFATKEEIERAEDRIMVGEYEVKIADATTLDGITHIGVGCQRVNKETFLKIGKKAHWL